MTPALKDKWCAALRSGDYKQGQGTLKTVEGAYCCLGVLAHIASAEMEWYGVFVRETSGGIVVFADKESRGSEFPARLLKEVGLTEDQQNDLIGLNDDNEAPFNEIADWIMENVR